MTPLHQLGDLLREALAAVPMGLAQALFLALPLIVLIWVLRLPREETTPPEARSSLANLKLWAALALVIQVVIYAYMS